MLEGVQYEGGTASVQRSVYNVDQSPHQYKGSTSLVLMKMCNTGIIKTDQCV